MSADSNVREIANFRSETAVVYGLRLHYWIGGDSNGIPVLFACRGWFFNPRT
jgi:hypothetical protein